MRASQQIPGSRWPHDMVITVEDGSQALIDLLWIREAWQLKLDGDDLPPRLVDTPTPVSESKRKTAPITDWANAWPPLWRECLLHAATPSERPAFDLLGDTPPGPGRARLLKEIVGPTWDDRFGRDAFTEEYQQWETMLFERRRNGIQRPLGEQPERAALEALIPAWRAGLTMVVEIPCRGAFTRVVGPHGLLVTAETRAAPDGYRAALARFR